MLLKQIRPAVILLVLFTVITGFLYPLVVTGVAQIVFPAKANGSMLMQDGKIVGSELIGQPFSGPQYFWSRPSATAPVAYNASASAGSNLGPMNPTLVEAVTARVKELKKADPENLEAIPVDLVTTSGSGLDPHISVAGALYQVARVARARHVTDERIRAIVDRCVEPRQLGILGEPRVNVLKLNIALDAANELPVPR